VLEINPLTRFDEVAFRHIATGYTSDSRYVVRRMEGAERVEIIIELVQLSEPKTVVYSHESYQMESYRQVVSKGFSFGAFVDGEIVGIALAEHQEWNNSLWVWEFHVAVSYRGQGVGSRLMQTLIDQAHANEIRVIVCETQTTNVHAIRFYRKAGFEMDGIDISYYTNTDLARHDVAVFMKKKLN
jgi:streptothricin acetyltransferase